jgi:hypothetical protein
MQKYFKYRYLLVLAFSVTSVLKAMDTQFVPLKLGPAKQLAEEYIKKAQGLSSSTGVSLSSNLSVVLPSNLGQLRLAGSQWKKEYERLLAIEAAQGLTSDNSVLSSPIVAKKSHDSAIPSLVEPS